VPPVNVADVGAVFVKVATEPLLLLVMVTAPNAAGESAATKATAETALNVFMDYYSFSLSLVKLLLTEKPHQTDALPSRLCHLRRRDRTRPATPSRASDPGPGTFSKMSANVRNEPSSS